MSAMLYRVVVAENVCDKAISASVFNACGTALIMALGVLMDAQLFFIDVSLVYACVGLVSAVGLARFIMSDRR